MSPTAHNDHTHDHSQPYSHPLDQQEQTADVDQQPVIERDFYSIDPSAVRVEQISGLILFAFLALAAIVVLGYLFFQDGFDTTWLIVAGISAFILIWSLISSLVWPPISCKRIQWCLDDDGLHIHQGVFWHSKTCVPLTRVQHADVTQGPIQRNYGLGTLTVHTAGTSDASVDLPGLNHQVAMSLRNQLVRQREVNPLHE